MKFDPHPAAAAFPLMSGDDFKGLVEDIKINGQRLPIVLIDEDGKRLVLDGRNRLRACEELGVEPLTEAYEGDDPVAYVVSVNIARRHLNESQRAIVSAKLELMDRNAQSRQPSGKFAERSGLKTAEVAKLLNVSERSVSSAKKVLTKAEPEVKDAVERGELAVSRAAELADLAPEKQRQAAADAAQGRKPQREHPAGLFCAKCRGPVKEKNLGEQILAGCAQCGPLLYRWTRA